MPEHYLYNADVYCSACAADIKARIRRQGPPPLDREDSDQWPQGPYSDQESDTPQHCASGPDCLDPTEIEGVTHGQFFENPLTAEGCDYVRGAHADCPSEVTRFWLDFYDLHPPEDDDEGAALWEADQERQATDRARSQCADFLGDFDTANDAPNL